MAEIRKHRPRVTSAIDSALAKAMGEPVRPVTPGSGGDSEVVGREAVGESQAAAGLSVTGVPATGGWRFVTGGARPVRTAAPASASSADDFEDDEPHD